jgi:hypothetical protein
MSARTRQLASCIADVDSDRRTVGQIIDRMESIARDPATAAERDAFAAAARQRDRADYQRRFGEKAPW